MAVTWAQTAPTWRRWVRTGCQAGGGTQNHSGSPTRPSFPRGGAVAACRVGTVSWPSTSCSSSWGVTAGAAPAPSATRVTPPNGELPGQVIAAHSSPAGAGGRPRKLSCAGDSGCSVQLTLPPPPPPPPPPGPPGVPPPLLHTTTQVLGGSKVVTQPPLPGGPLAAAGLAPAAAAGYKSAAAMAAAAIPARTAGRRAVRNLRAGMAPPRAPCC